jgi:preprotein translocase subunit SecG
MTFLLVFHFTICAFLVFVILLQPGKSDGGIGFGSSSQSIFGSRGAGNFLTKLTSGCAILFLFTSFLLTRARMKQYAGSVIGNEPAADQAQPSVPPSPAAAQPSPAASSEEKK